MLGMNKNQRLMINQRRFAGPRLVLFASLMICVVVGIFFMVGNLLTRQSSATVMGDMGWSFSQITSIDTHTCAITSEGKAYCWGMNVYGQLGNNSTTSSRIPVAVQMPAGVSFQSITAGYFHTCALTTTGQAYCWGWNQYGQLGNNSTTSSRIPVAVQMPAGVSFQSITAGYFHTCALTTTGQAYCWGWNQYGQLGNNSTTSSRIPVAVQMPAGVSFQSITADYFHTCALTTTGQAYCWGANSYGQLGNNSTTNSLTPAAVQMPAGVSFQSIAADYYHTCALTTTGQAYCWGMNGYGQLGNNSTTDSRIPVAVQMPAGVTRFQSIAAGVFHTCAITNEGKAYCWGWNRYGQLGNNSPTNSRIPVAVQMPAGVSFQSITAGYFHTCALTTTGQAYCWGWNQYGQLGNNSTANSPIPLAVSSVGVNVPVEQSPSRLYKWNNAVQPGTPLAATNAVATLPEVGSSFRIRVGLTAAGNKTLQSITAGYAHTCAITNEGKAYCWGWNRYGQLGNNSPTNSRIPVAVQMPAGVSFQSITAGYFHTCALTTTGQAYCWGWNQYGQLGNNSTTSSRIPVAVQMPAGVSFQSITADYFHTCALTTTGQAYCWGANSYGQLGNNSTTNSLTPVAVQMPAGVARFQSITTNSFHTCALTTTGQAYCWGANSYGQLGNNSTTNSLTPVAVQMPAGVARFQSITTNSFHTCALTATGQDYCWGWNQYGQLGNNSTTDSSIPVAVQMPAGVARFQSIAAGNYHTCAITNEGKAYCWGWNIYGRLGNNSTTDSSIPVAVQMPAGVSFQSITAGDEHTCALTTTGQAYCWGQGGSGQLGNNSTTNSSTPAAAPVKTMNNITVPPGNMKLRAQYAKKTAASCSAVPSGDWQNITTNSSLRYAATGPAHQTAISAISDNPALPANSHNYAHQSIVRPTTDSSLTFTNDQGIESGQTGLWDLVLTDNGLEQNTSYCVRVVTDTAAAPGTSVDTYTVYPEFKTPTGSLDIRFVNNITNATIANPTIDFTPTVTQSSVARTTANLTEAATGTRHLEIKNTLPTGWSVTLSATAGSNARWSSGTDDYAFNGTEANGRLSVLFNNTVITRISGSAACASATKGQNGVFTATNTVKIASAAGGAAGCTYRIADIGLQQTIPAYQKPGTYTLPMTLTAVAE